MRFTDDSAAFCHTYSIVARDRASGDIGVAVQSHWFSVGGIVPWAEAGVGGVATQAMVRTSYGPLGLDLLRKGASPEAALSKLVAADEGRELRQVAFVDARGRVAAHTGKRCLQEAGHFEGDGFVAQANMMRNAGVWPAMAQAFESVRGDLAERMLCALEAAQAAGGDLRGQQSACLRVVSGSGGPSPWDHVLFDLRVEDSPWPLAELRRLVRIRRAYRLMSEGDDHLGKGDVEPALKAYAGADALAPDVLEPAFWHAVALADLGRVNEALPIFERVVRSEPSWVELFSRLSAAGFARENGDLLRRLQEMIPD
jgi:uncharacterized Ntn-hydrolase superfamily protein